MPKGDESLHVRKPGKAGSQVLIKHKSINVDRFPRIYITVWSGGTNTKSQCCAYNNSKMTTRPVGTPASCQLFISLVPYTRGAFLSCHTGTFHDDRSLNLYFSTGTQIGCVNSFFLIDHCPTRHLQQKRNKILNLSKQLWDGMWQRRSSPKCGENKNTFQIQSEWFIPLIRGCSSGKSARPMPPLPKSVVIMLTTMIDSASSLKFCLDFTKIDI